MDPILQAATSHVEPLAAMTAPFPTTIAAGYVYFKSDHDHISAIREDGKRLTFTNHYFKTNIEEDITYLRSQITKQGAGCVFSECSDSTDLAVAEQALDPVGATEKRIRAKIMAELAAAGKLAETAGSEVIKKVEQALGISDAEKIAGVDAAAIARQKLAAMKTENTSVQVNTLNPGNVPVLTPVSSSDIASAASGSDSGSSAVTAAGSK